MVYVLELESFKGPVEKLLELVEGRKMEVTLVSLSKVTGDFLDYFNDLKNKADEESDCLRDGGALDAGVGLCMPERVDLKSVLADFLVVASRLLLIKSKVLVPSLELNKDEEEEIRDLEFRLKLYQKLKQTKVFVSERWSDRQLMVSRDFLMTKEPFFYPPPEVGAFEIQRALEGVIRELQKFLLPKDEIKGGVINLKSKIEEVLERISSEPRGLEGLRSRKTRDELVALFLAVLHLVKNQLIDVEQDDHFGEIMVVKR